MPDAAAHFADGTSDTGDLLVGADRANSRVRGQLLPHADRIDTGVRAIAGKYPLTDASRRAIPAELTARANIVLPKGRGFMFTAVWGGATHDATGYTFWAFADAATRFPDLTGSSVGQLRDVTLAQIADWSPALRHLVAGSDPDTVNLVRVRSAAPVRPWPTGPVTLLGDAIHNMTPMAGIGANTALRDADLLRRQLIAAHRGELTLPDAVHGYERQMLGYGFAAVRRSLRNAKQAASANPVGRAAFRRVLRLTAAVPPLKRRMGASLGS